MLLLDVALVMPDEDNSPNWYEAGIELRCGNCRYIIEGWEREIGVLEQSQPLTEEEAIASSHELIGQLIDDNTKLEIYFPKFYRHRECPDCEEDYSDLRGQLTAEGHDNPNKAPNVFVLHIELDNEAMRSANKIADALINVAQRLRKSKENGAICDLNGNKVGNYEFTFKVE